MVPPWISINSGPTRTPESSPQSVKFSYVSSSEYRITLSPGQYLFEVWGASGGNASISSDGSSISVGKGVGGFGGYSKGSITLTKHTTCFIHVGQSGFAVPGPNLNHAGTYGGGGGVYTSPSSANGITGGGSSDIRLYEDDLFHRIIVGGGGGGATGCYTGQQMPGGHAGGLIGGKGLCDSSPGIYYSTGGEQVFGGKSISQWGIPGDIGDFGKGGRSVNTAGTNYGGGGGGGWYGGCGGGHRVSGGGGSSFVFEQKAIINSSYSIDSSHYLTNTLLIGGGSPMPSRAIPRTFTNLSAYWQGNGNVIITVLKYSNNAISRFRNHYSFLSLTLASYTLVFKSEK